MIKKKRRKTKITADFLALILMFITILNIYKPIEVQAASMTKTCTFTIENLGENSELKIIYYYDKDTSKIDPMHNEWKCSSGTWIPNNNKDKYGSITVTYNSSKKSYTVTYNNLLIQDYTPWVYCEAGTKTGYTAKNFVTINGSATGNKNEIGIIVDNQDTQKDAAGYFCPIQILF